MSDASMKKAILARYLEVLDALAAARVPLSAPEIASHLGVPISSTYRLIANLKALNLVVHIEGSNTYWLGLKCLEYGGAVMEALNVRTVALPVMRDLSASCAETVHLTIRDGDEGIFIEKVEARHGAVRWHTEIGRRVPLYAGASMKVQLAFLPSDERNAILSRRPLTKVASGTLTDLVQLQAELATIRVRGWASSMEELNEGAAGVSAPVLDHMGQVVAGLTITGPRARLERRLTELAALVMGAAERISSQLGHVTRHGSPQADPVAATQGVSRG